MTIIDRIFKKRALLKAKIEAEAKRLLAEHGERALGIATDKCVETAQNGGDNHFWSRVRRQIKDELGIGPREPYGGW